MNKALTNPPKRGWIRKGKLFLQPYAYISISDWLQMVYKECPELGKWVSKNQTVNKYTLANIICEILDEKYERV